jgi:sulfoxide reductase heme-binding subunit YedZ
MTQMAQTSSRARLGRAVFGSVPVRRAIYIVGSMPALWYFYRAFTDQLGIDPQNVLERALGLWALRFLIISLAISPLRRLGGPSFIRYRRAVGLLAFYYALLHVSVYLLLDQQLDMAAILADIARRPYITVGLIAFAILLPLAVTSNTSMIRRLGARWQSLHRLVYVASAAAVLHFIMVVKVWQVELLFYALCVSLLLLFRLQQSAAKRLGRSASPVRGRQARRA